MVPFGFSQIQLHTKLTPVNISHSAAASDIEMPLEGPPNQTPELPEIVSGVQRTDLHSTNTTLYFCPLTACRFKTTREGMLNGKAAQHLKGEHKLTGAMMKNSPFGTYKFRTSTVRQPLKTLMKSRSGETLTSRKVRKYLKNLKI